MTPDLIRQTLARLAAVERDACDALRTLRQTLDDLHASVETGRQLRAGLVAILTPQDHGSAPSAVPDATIPTPTAYARLILQDGCGGPSVRRAS